MKHVTVTITVNAARELAKIKAGIFTIDELDDIVIAAIDYMLDDNACLEEAGARRTLLDTEQAKLMDARRTIRQARMTRRLRRVTPHA